MRQTDYRTESIGRGRAMIVTTILILAVATIICLTAHRPAASNPHPRPTSRGQ